MIKIFEIISKLYEKITFNTIINNIFMIFFYYKDNLKISMLPRFA